MFRRRPRLPRELRDALRAAERAGRARKPWPLSRLAMAGWFLFVFVLVVVVGSQSHWRPWLQDAAPSWTGPSAWQAPRPRVVYGIPEGTAASAGGTGRRFTAHASVIDGDTLATGVGRLRIFGIDAPESAQTCRRRGQSYACGAEASRVMAALLGAGILACEALDTDRYGRTVARCRNARDTDIGGELVRQGWAVAFTRYSEAYLAQEREARAAGRGLWAGDFEMPAEWRARHRH